MKTLIVATFALFLSVSAAAETAKELSIWVGAEARGEAGSSGCSASALGGIARVASAFATARSANACTVTALVGDTVGNEIQTPANVDQFLESLALSIYVPGPKDLDALASASATVSPRALKWVATNLIGAKSKTGSPKGDRLVRVGNRTVCGVQVRALGFVDCKRLAKTTLQRLGARCVSPVEALRTVGESGAGLDMWLGAFGNKTLNAMSGVARTPRLVVDTAAAETAVEAVQRTPEELYTTPLSGLRSLTHVTFAPTLPEARFRWESPAMTLAALQKLRANVLGTEKLARIERRNFEAVAEGRGGKPLAVESESVLIDGRFDRR